MLSLRLLDPDTLAVALGLEIESCIAKAAQEARLKGRAADECHVRRQPLEKKPMERIVVTSLHLLGGRGWHLRELVLPWNVLEDSSRQP